MNVRHSFRPGFHNFIIVNLLKIPVPIPMISNIEAGLYVLEALPVSYSGKNRENAIMKGKTMKKNRLVQTNAAAVAAVTFAVCMIIPCSSFAFRNPNRNPQDIVQQKPSTPAGSIAQGAVPAGSNQDEASQAAEKGGFENSAAAVLSPGEISMAAASDALLKSSGLIDFNRTSGRRWQAAFSAQTGNVTRLFGAASKPYSGGPESAARAFLQDAHALFGLQADLSGLTTAKISQTPERQHVRFQQAYNGVPVQGAHITVHSDPQGHVTMVQNSCPGKTTPANQNRMNRETAQGIARNDLGAYLGAQTALSDSEAENLIVPCKSGYCYIWKITTPVKNPPGLWVSHVDAESGEIVYRANEVLYIKDGQGRGYRNNDEYWLGRIRGVKLYDLFETKDMYLQGLLHGTHATIYDYAESCSDTDGEAKCRKLDGLNLAYAPDLNFKYYPDVSEDNYPYTDSKSWFDQAHAYYKHTEVWEWWQKNVIQKYGPSNIDYFYWLSIPAVVNVGSWDEDGLSLFCNAFYSPVQFLNPENDNLPGFAYSDDGSCTISDYGADLVNDSDIVRHEYTHAIMDWAGFDDSGQFGGEVDGYGRSMGEGNSDWYAFLASGKPDIGYVAFPPWGLRTIDNANRYPDDVDDPSYLYSTDNESDCAGELIALPEEHYTGEIWGGYLFELSRVLKTKALGFVYPSSFYFETDGGHRDGYSDFVDAIRAQRDAELDRTGSNKLFLKAFGSMVSRGFIRPLAPLYSSCDYFGTGISGTDERDYIWLNAPLKLKTEANLLITGDLHEYPVYAYAGMNLTAQVKAKSVGMRGPSIKLYSIDGTLLDFIDYTSNTQVKKASLTYTIPADGMYVVRVSGRTEPRRGYYTFQLTVQ